ncbi:hypothetical protein [Shewanella sp. SE1]|uniref:hypothetical protein n=1 Tax=Shewanella sp. SE1 TaxID=2705014 RepID=UPI00138F107F|nr:hypothetical protein [Shewanella sp. SE1]NDO73059.1 hypothetical protein [Shewanella sp. SE1]
MKILNRQFEDNVLSELKKLADGETCIIELVDPIDIIKSNEVRFSPVLRIGRGGGKCIAWMTGTNRTTYEQVHDHFNRFFCVSFS